MTRPYELVSAADVRRFRANTAALIGWLVETLAPDDPAGEQLTDALVDLAAAAARQVIGDRPMTDGKLTWLELRRILHLRLLCFTQKLGDW